MNADRQERVADAIRAELAAIVQREMADPRAKLVSVTDVVVSRDFAFADVYVSSLAASDTAAQGDLVRVLTGAAGFLRHRLAARQALPATPRLRFHYDELMERGPRLEALIDATVRAQRQAGAPDVQ